MRRRGRRRSAVWNRQAHRAAQSLIRTHRPDVVHAFKLYPQLSVAPVVAAHRAGIPVVQTALDYEFISANQFDRRRVEPRPIGDEVHVSAAQRVASRDSTVGYHLPRLSRVVTCSRYMAAKYATHAIETEVAPEPGPSVRRCDARLAGSHGCGLRGAPASDEGRARCDQRRRAGAGDHVHVIGRGPLDDEVPSRGGAPAQSRAPRMGADLPDLRETPCRRARRAHAVEWEEPGALISLEAMATGTPLISYRAGGLTEYVEDAGRGRRGSTPEDLANAVREVSGTEDIWTTLLGRRRSRRPRLCTHPKSTSVGTKDLRGRRLRPAGGRVRRDVVLILVAHVRAERQAQRPVRRCPSQPVATRERARTGRGRTDAGGRRGSGLRCRSCVPRALRAARLVLSGASSVTSTW